RYRSRHDKKRKSGEKSRYVKYDRDGETGNPSGESEQTPQRQKEIARLGFRSERVAHQQVAVQALTHPGKVSEGVIVSAQHSSEYCSLWGSSKRYRVRKSCYD